MSVCPAGTGTPPWQRNVLVVSEVLPNVTVVCIILERRRPAFATRERKTGGYGDPRGTRLQLDPCPRRTVTG
jgi:hypothetical protein